MFLKIESGMLKNLLVYIPSERPIRPVVDGAISLAASYGAKLDAVSVGFETANLGLVMETSGAVMDAAFEIERKNALARADRALAVFEEEARHAGIGYNLQAFGCLPAEATALVSTIARLYDLTIVQQPEFECDTFDNTIPLEILFQSGGPVLFVPHIHNGPLALKRIGIAWDGSRLAARALRDAMPFLAHTKEIIIISVNDTDPEASVSAKSLAAYLARCGLTSRIERLTVSRNEIHTAILSIAVDDSLDLIVMGGYGHSRFKERIFGGVTRGMLQSMTLPTLMSH